MSSSKGSNDILVKKLDFSKTSKQISLGNESNSSEIKNLEKKVNEMYNFMTSMQEKIYPISESIDQIKVKNLEVDDGILKTISDDIVNLKILVGEQNEKINDLSKKVSHEMEVLKSKEEQTKLIKDGVEESFAKLISIKNSEAPDLTSLKQSHLELDMLTKNNQFDIKKIQDDIDQIVIKSINKNLESKLLEKVDQKITENSERIESIFNNSINNIIDSKIKQLQSNVNTNTTSIDKLIEESEIANQIIKEAERINAEKAANDKVAAEKAAIEKAVAEKAAIEKASVEKDAAEKAAAEKAAAEKAAAEKAAAEKAAAEKAAAEKEAAEKDSNDSFNVNDKDLIKFKDAIVNDEIKIYPNSGYTLYFYVDNQNYGVDENASLAIIVNGEVRGKTTEFIEHDGKVFTSVNVNVKEDNEEIESIILLTVNQLFIPAKKYNLNSLQIGENNLEKYPDLPYIHFKPS